MTGYTYELVDKNLDFPQFALCCARAFGPLMSMRDYPLDAKIPDKILPITTYHKTELDRNQKIYNRIIKYNKEQLTKWAIREKNKELGFLKKGLKKKKDNQANVIKMKSTLKEVEAWEIPTPEHEALKTYMIQQLSSSIEVEERHEEYYANAFKKEHEKPIGKFIEERLTRIKKDIIYHKKHWEKDVKDAEFCTNWINTLRQSLVKK